MTNNEFIEQFKDCYKTDVEFRKFLWGELLDNLCVNTSSEWEVFNTKLSVHKAVFEDNIPKKPQISSQYMFEKFTDIIQDDAEALQRIMHRMAELSLHEEQIQYNTPVGHVIFKLNAH